MSFAPGSQACGDAVALALRDSMRSPVGGGSLSHRPPVSPPSPAEQQLMECVTLRQKSASLGAYLSPDQLRRLMQGPQLRPEPATINPEAAKGEARADKPRWVDVDG